MIPSASDDKDGQDVPLETIRMCVEEWRGRACLEIQKGVREKGSIEASPKASMANEVEQRAARLTRRVERLMVMSDRGISNISTIRLPATWSMADLDEALKKIGATSEMRPERGNDGSRRRPPLEFK